MISNAGKLFLIGFEFNWFNKKELSSKIIQKSIYILQIMGLTQNYSYGWYTTGPYSSDLSSVIYDIACNYDYYSNEIEDYKLSDKANTVISEFKEKFSETMNDSTFIEFVASMLFLKEYYPNDNDAETFRKLKEQKAIFKNGKYDCYFNAALIKVNELRM